MSETRPGLKHILPITIAALAAMLATLWLTRIYRDNHAGAVLLPDEVIRVLEYPRPLTDFALVDQEGRAFDLASLRGKWTFIFFGFTHCPDICPTTLAELARVRTALAGRAPADDDIDFVFVSVDPHRDSTIDLARYVHHFDPRLRGVTGDPEQIATLAAGLGAAYRVEWSPGAADYPVYHTTAVFLVDPDARHRAVFTPPLDATAIAGRFEGLRRIAAGSAPLGR